MQSVPLQRVRDKVWPILKLGEMKNKLFVAAALLLFSIFAIAENKTDENAVIQICNAWDDAYIKKDPKPLEKLLTADYVGIDEEGAVTTKTDEINLIKSGEYVIFSVDHVEPQKVRLYGTTAIVTSHATVKHASKGETNTVIGRATTVCVNKNGQWQIASWHASRVK
jgi:ketosteroid isomerase-like protein